VLVSRPDDPAQICRSVALRQHDPGVDEPKRVVRDGYDRIALQYESWADHGGVRQKYLSQVRAAVPAGERVVDLGCGTGRHATRHLAERYRVVGVDISPVSASLAQKAIPAARFVVGDMTDVSFPPGVFGGVTAFFSLIHVPRNEHADVLRATRSWLKPGGILVVTMGVSDSEKDTGSFLGAPMYWSSWSRAENVRLVEEAGYRLRSATDETELENGTPVTHLWVVAHAA
jgi:ubiquinone/menaquinone biosynthesis C-methylase UbiE